MMLIPLFIIDVLFLLSALLPPDGPLRADDDEEDYESQDARYGNACGLDDFFHALSFC